MEQQVQPYDRCGAWVSSHSAYYEWAYAYRDAFEKTLHELLAEESRIRSEHQTDFEEASDLDAFVHYGSSGLHDLAHMYATSSFIFACMALEGFINNYGTVRLGEAFFKKNMERLGITEKLSVLILICLGIVLDKDDPLIVKTRSIFDERNRLVHPKTKEFDSENPAHGAYVHPKDVGLEKSLMDLECVIDRLCELDPAIRMRSTFKKPNNGLHADADKAPRR